MSLKPGKYKLVKLASCGQPAKQPAKRWLKFLGETVEVTGPSVIDGHEDCCVRIRHEEMEALARKITKTDPPEGFCVSITCLERLQ